eukprot:s708_g20.t1
MLKIENQTSQEYWDKLQVYVQAEASSVGKDLLPAIGGQDRSPLVESLDTEVKIQQLKIHDIVEEASEYGRENLRLKDEMCEMTMNVLSAQSDKDIKKVNEAYNDEVREVEALRRGQPGRNEADAERQNWDSSSRLPSNAGPVLYDDFLQPVPAPGPPPRETSNRGSISDDVTSPANLSGAEAPRIS